MLHAYINKIMDKHLSNWLFTYDIYSQLTPLPSKKYFSSLSSMLLATLTLKPNINLTNQTGLGAPMLSGN
jgi:hypothetical protein